MSTSQWLDPLVTLPGAFQVCWVRILTMDRAPIQATFNFATIQFQLTTLPGGPSVDPWLVLAWRPV